jgi:hypothetical protein
MVQPGPTTGNACDHPLFYSLPGLVPISRGRHTDRLNKRIIETCDKIFRPNHKNSLKLPKSEKFEFCLCLFCRDWGIQGIEKEDVLCFGSVQE